MNERGGKVQVKADLLCYIVDGPHFAAFASLHSEAKRSEHHNTDSLDRFACGSQLISTQWPCTRIVDQASMKSTALKRAFSHDSACVKSNAGDTRCRGATIPIPTTDKTNLVSVTPAHRGQPVLTVRCLNVVEVPRLRIVEDTSWRLPPKSQKRGHGAVQYCVAHCTRAGTDCCMKLPWTRGNQSSCSTLRRCTDSWPRQGSEAECGSALAGVNASA